MLSLIYAMQFIMTFQPNIILIFSIEMQPIYPISKQEVSLNLDCNFQAIDSQHCRCAGLADGNTDVRSQDWQQGNAADH